MTPNQSEPLTLGDRTINSRFLAGTGKFSSNESMRDALRTSGSVTVDPKRANLIPETDPFANILDYLDADHNLILSNTAGAMNAEEAIRIARLAAAVILPQWNDQ